MPIQKNIDCYNSSFSKAEIEKRLNDYCKANSINGLGLSTSIIWLNNVCESYDEALAFLKSLDETKYPQIAIQYEETCVGYETSYKYWLVMTQFEIKPKRKMSKGECLDCLYYLMEQLNNSTDDMALDQYRAVEIAVALIENSTDKTFKEAV